MPDGVNSSQPTKHSASPSPILAKPDESVTPNALTPSWRSGVTNAGAAMRRPARSSSVRRVGETDWIGWHEQYESANSPLAERLAVIQAHITATLDASDGRDLNVISICAGDGRDLLTVLASHPFGRKVTARLVEADLVLAEAARDRARAGDLREVEIVAGDAGVTDAYVGAAPADLVLACGVFGNVEDADVERTIQAMPSLCAKNGVVIWTRHRRHPDITPTIRRWFAEAGFEERGFTSPGLDSFAVGVHQLKTEPTPLFAGQTLFVFVR